MDCGESSDEGGTVGSSQDTLSPSLPCPEQTSSGGQGVSSCGGEILESSHKVPGRGLSLPYQGLSLCQGSFSEEHDLIIPVEDIIFEDENGNILGEDMYTTYIIH